MEGDGSGGCEFSRVPCGIKLLAYLLFIFSHPFVYVLWFVILTDLASAFFFPYLKDRLSVSSASE